MASGVPWELAVQWINPANKLEPGRNTSWAILSVDVVACYFAKERSLIELLGDHGIDHLATSESRAARSPAIQPTQKDHGCCERQENEDILFECRATASPGPDQVRNWQRTL